MTFYYHCAVLPALQRNELCVIVATWEPSGLGEGPILSLIDLAKTHFQREEDLCPNGSPNTNRNYTDNCGEEHDIANPDLDR
jgi:hypothetical protein